MGPALGSLDLTVRRGDEVVLRRLTLTVPAGRTTVLLGPSGSGKTTLLRCLVGLGPEPDGGRVEWDGRDPGRLSRAEVQEFRRAAGVALGGSSVYDSWTYGSESVAGQVTRAARIRGVAEEEIPAQVADRLRDLGLDDRAGHLPAQLAAHARRRLAIATALVGSPGLLVLDDPETACDAISRDRIVRAIRLAGARSGSTVVVATGDLGMARALGGRLALLGRGRIVVQGEAGSLLDGVRDAEDLASRYPDGTALVDPSTAEPAPSSGRTIHVDPYVLMWLSIVLLVLVLVATVVHRLAPG